MTADKVLQYVTDLLFGIVFIAALIGALRRPRRASIDLALLFAPLAIIIAETLVAGALQVRPERWVTVVVVSLLMAMPYLLLRLAGDFTDLPRWIARSAIAGWLLSTAGIAAFETLPTWFGLALVADFAAFSAYAGVALWREATRSAGVTRRRVQALAAGTLLLGAALLAAGLAVVAPILSAGTGVLALGAAAAFVVGVSPPALLRHAWQMPDLYAFLSAGVSSARTADASAIISALEDAAGKATGMTGNIGLWDDAAQVLRFRVGGEERVVTPSESISGRAFTSRTAMLSTDPERDSPKYADEFRARRSRAVLAAPMRLGDAALGTLVLQARHAPLFAEDDLAYVQLLADQAAKALDAVRLYEELAKASRAKSEFLSSMSHELRTPMNAILGFSELLREQLDGSLSDRQRRYFQNIADAGQHLLALINDVLDLSKVEAGRIELRPEIVELPVLVEPVLAAARENAREREVRFDAIVQADGLVRVDAARVRQVLYNLVSNAIKFTPPSGRVSLSVGFDGDDLRIDVRDTGIGIPADRRERVFGMFERLNEGRSAASGTGLGLALTKRLVELHQGSIDFESQENVGTTFRVRLPSVSARAVTGERILVVEDEQRDADLVADMAAAAGLRTEVVGSAIGARAAIRRNPPIGVVLDLRLPDERGEVILAELRSDPATRSLPIVVVTVEDDDGRARQLGADDHLTKPIERARLGAWLARLAARRQERQTPVRA